MEKERHALREKDISLTVQAARIDAAADSKGISLLMRLGAVAEEQQDPILRQELRTVHNELRDGTQRPLDRIGQPGRLGRHVHDAVGTLVQGLKRATGLARKRNVEEHRHESNRQRPSNKDQYQRLTRGGRGGGRGGRGGRGRATVTRVNHQFNAACHQAAKRQRKD